MSSRFTEEPYEYVDGPQILCVYETHPLRRQTLVVDFAWHGPVDAPVKITGEMLLYAGVGRVEKFPERLTCFPWPLRKVEAEDWHVFSAKYVRTDAGRLTWLYYAAAARARRAWRWFFSRLVWTLVVWGLASIEYGTFPTWDDVLKPQRRSTAWRRWRARLVRRLS